MCDDLQGRVLDGAVHLVHTDAPLLFENDLIKVDKLKIFLYYAFLELKDIN